MRGNARHEVRTSCPGKAPGRGKSGGIGARLMGVGVLPHPGPLLLGEGMGFAALLPLA